MSDKAAIREPWRSIADLFSADSSAPVALLGVPLCRGSVTAGRCDLAPARLRQALRRISTYDLETGTDVGDLSLFDLGDLGVEALMPGDAANRISEAVRAAVSAHRLLVIAGGHNGVTRPAVLGLGPDLNEVGLITLDAHYDLRDTADGMRNGNPVRALLEDGLPGKNIVQIGLAPFANTRRMHEIAQTNGMTGITAREVRERGISVAIDDALAVLGTRCRRIYVDFDIDVIDRAQCPGAPGARPGGMTVFDFFTATRRLCADPRVVAVDLTEFDPALDLSDISALTAGRWLAEVLCGAAPRLR